MHALTIFSMRGLDLSKLESRPLPAGSLGDAIRAMFTADKQFPTMFVLDVLGATTDTTMQNAIRHLQEENTFVRVLGSYPIE